MKKKKVLRKAKIIATIRVIFSVRFFIYSLSVTCGEGFTLIIASIVNI